MTKEKTVEIKNKEAHIECIKAIQKDALVRLREQGNAVDPERMSQIVAINQYRDDCMFAYGHVPMEALLAMRDYLNSVK